MLIGSEDAGEPKRSGAGADSPAGGAAPDAGPPPAAGADSPAGGAAPDAGPPPAAGADSPAGGPPPDAGPPPAAGADSPAGGAAPDAGRPPAAGAGPPPAPSPDDAPAATASPAPDGRPPTFGSDPVATARLAPGRRWLAAVVAILIAAALVVVLLVLLSARHRINQLDDLNSARTSALAAARTYSVEVASYDYRQLPQDFQTVEKHSTASFAATFTQSSKALNGVLTQYHAIATAHVIAAGLESATTTDAVAAVFINQTVTNSTQKTPTTDQSRIEITLVRQHGQWLINQLKLL